MLKPRREQVCLDITQNYHIVSLCVRPGFLCRTFGNNTYGHRKEWIESKLADLVNIFAIQLYGYAIVSNHYHLVVHVNPQEAQQWSDREVVLRWREIFTSDVLGKRYEDGGNLDESEWAVLKKCIEIWRERLSDISWFMRVLNEFIARAANKEEQCTGRFWEGRYKSQALLGSEALLAAMVYVDLNPICANMANTIPASDFTSGQQRFRKECGQPSDDTRENAPPSLLDLSDEPHSELPITPRNYLELIDYSGRLIKADKAGYKRGSQPAILDQLKLSKQQWPSLCKDFESPFKQFLGTYHKIKQACRQLGKTSLHGLGAAKRLFAV